MNSSPSAASYIGLFFTLWLAIISYFYLSIATGTFGAFSLFWAVAYGAGLLVGYAQKGTESKKAKVLQTILLIPCFLLIVTMVLNGAFQIGLVITLLGLIQLAYNVTLVTRRGLHLSCVVALVMVIYTCCSVRADWTLLFYVVPFLVALVFTLTSDEITQRITEIRQAGSQYEVMRGQGWAVLSATALILLGSVLFYVVTPQLHVSDYSWRLGEPALSPQTGDDGDSDLQQELNLGIGSGTTTGRNSTRERGFSLTPDQIREAAERPGMPRWQAGLMLTMADGAEETNQLVEKIKALVNPALQLLRELSSRYEEALRQLLALLLLLALVAYLGWKLRLFAWLRTRWDNYSLRWQKGSSREVVLAIYRRGERLFAYHQHKRPPTMTPSEYGGALSARWPSLSDDIRQLIQAFETARYSDEQIDENHEQQIKDTYSALYRQIGNT